MGPIISSEGRDRVFIIRDVQLNAWVKNPPYLLHFLYDLWRESAMSNQLSVPGWQVPSRALGVLGGARRGWTEAALPALAVAWLRVLRGLHWIPDQVGNDMRGGAFAWVGG